MFSETFCTFGHETLPNVFEPTSPENSIHANVVNLKMNWEFPPVDALLAIGARSWCADLLTFLR